jgi:hypothetical protein
VPGEANPGHADPSADVAEGELNPRRGDLTRHGQRGSKKELKRLKGFITLFIIMNIEKGSNSFFFVFNYRK